MERRTCKMTSKSVFFAALLSVAVAMRTEEATPSLQPTHAFGNAAGCVEKTSGETESFMEAKQPEVAENLPQDHGEGKDIKHFRQGPFNDGDRPLDIYCVLIQHALEDSMEAGIAERNLMTNANIEGFITLGQVKLASAGNVSCKAVYKTPGEEEPDADPHVQVEFVTKGLNISSSVVTAHVKAIDATVNLGFTMDIEFGLMINTVHNSVEVTKSNVTNLEPRSSSQENTVSTIAALAVKMGVGATYINEALSQVGNYVGKRFTRPETSCNIMRHAVLPLAVTDLDFSFIEPVNISGQMLKFRADHLNIPPNFLCQNFSFNGHHLTVDLRDVELNAQVFLDKLDNVSAEDVDGVAQEVDTNSATNISATLHVVQSISLDLDILEPKNAVITPSNVTVDIQIPDGHHQQVFANFAAIVSQSSMNQFWVASSVAAWILEELKTGTPLLEQHGGAGPALAKLTNVGLGAGLHDIWNSVWDWALAALRKA